MLGACDWISCGHWVKGWCVETRAVGRYEAVADYVISLLKHEMRLDLTQGRKFERERGETQRERERKRVGWGWGAETQRERRGGRGERVSKKLFYEQRNQDHCHLFLNWLCSCFTFSTTWPFRFSLQFGYNNLQFGYNNLQFGHKYPQKCPTFRPDSYSKQQETMALFDTTSVPHSQSLLHFCVLCTGS